MVKLRAPDWRCFFAAFDSSRAKGCISSWYIIVDNFLLLIFIYYTGPGKQLKQITTWFWSFVDFKETLVEPRLTYC